MDTIFLEDRVAFAAVHLADHPLNEYLQSCQKRAIAGGLLSGLLVTGLNSADSCIAILQKYKMKSSILPLLIGFFSVMSIVLAMFRRRH